MAQSWQHYHPRKVFGTSQRHARGATKLWRVRAPCHRARKRKDGVHHGELEHGRQDADENDCADSIDGVARKYRKLSMNLILGALWSPREREMDTLRNEEGQVLQQDRDREIWSPRAREIDT